MLERFRARVARLFAPKDMTSADLYRELLEKAWVDEETGMVVTPDLAMRLQAVYSCVRVVSEDSAALPLKLYERKEKGRGEVTEHWLFDLMMRPNPFQTGMEFREMQQAFLELNGNFYAIKTVVKEEIRELLPIPPFRMSVELQPNWTMKYKVTLPNGEPLEVPPSRVLHVRGLSFGNGIGISPIQWQRETLGWARGLSRYGSRLFKQGAMISGVVEMPQKMTLSDPAYKRMKESFDEKYAGIDNAQKTVLLEEGAQFKVTGMKAVDAEFLNSKKHSRTEIAGMYRVPLHMIGDLERATFSNIEQQSLDYVQRGLLPRLRRLEMRYNLDLIPVGEQRRLYFEHSVDGLLRGDFNSRQRGYQTAILTGYMSRNEARELDNRNPGPPELDEFLVPVNMAQADQINKKQDDDAAKEDDPPNPPPPPPRMPRMPDNSASRIVPHARLNGGG